ncbi:MAG TPA: hypothetical protein VH598_04435, partial [Verrucomicrobiae bacterium]|nr:hypothetical protein [Verrucomicrobiae bacterium]
MRASKIWWLAAVPILSLVLYFVFHEQQQDRERIAPDGTILRLEQVTFGRQDDFKPGGWRRQLRERLPGWLAKYFGSPYLSMSSWTSGQLNDTNRPALYIWFTRRDPNSGANLPVQLSAGQILDEHGSVFSVAMEGG